MTTRVRTDMIVVDAATGEWLPGLPTPALVERGRAHAWQMAEGIWRPAGPDDDEEAVYRAVRIQPAITLCANAGCSRTDARATESWRCPEHVPVPAGTIGSVEPVDESTDTSIMDAADPTTIKENPMTTNAHLGHESRPCRYCDFMAKNARGLSAHERIHRQEDGTFPDLDAGTAPDAPAEAPTDQDEAPGSEDATPEENEAHGGPEAPVGPIVKAGPAGVTLRDLIEAGVLVAPLDLETKYKGQIVTATVTEEGRVWYAGVSYASPSIAGAVARQQILGAAEAPATNGWTFWRYYPAEGAKSVPLANLRDGITIETVVRESATDAPRLDPEKVARLRAACTIIAEVDALGGDEYLAALEREDVQAAYELVRRATR